MRRNTSDHDLLIKISTQLEDLIRRVEQDNKDRESIDKGFNERIGFVEKICYTGQGALFVLNILIAYWLKNSH